MATLNVEQRGTIVSYIFVPLSDAFTAVVPNDQSEYNQNVAILKTLTRRGKVSESRTVIAVNAESAADVIDVINQERREFKLKQEFGDQNYHNYLTKTHDPRVAIEPNHHIFDEGLEHEKQTIESFKLISKQCEQMLSSLKNPHIRRDAKSHGIIDFLKTAPFAEHVRGNEVILTTSVEQYCEVKL